jgi:hypothetical protein
VSVALSTLNNAVIKIRDLKLSQRLKLIKSSQAISHVSRLKITEVSGTISAPITVTGSDVSSGSDQTSDPVTATEMVPEMPVIFN